MTMDLLRFLRDEVALHLELRKREGAPETTERALAELESWRETLTALFNRQLREGLPLK